MMKKFCCYLRMLQNTSWTNQITYWNCSMPVSSKYVYGKLWYINFTNR
jgi:hypothetical protein